MKLSRTILYLSAFALILLSSCAGSRNPNDKGVVSRVYHDVTARDNAYFNANLRILEAKDKLWEAQNDNYSEVLPMFKYGLENDAKGIGPDMDEVIKKASFPIQLHKDSRWVDDSYFLIGRAHFYKQDYSESLQAFQYLISEHSELFNKPRSKKKKSSSSKKKKSSSKKKKSSSSKKKSSSSKGKSSKKSSSSSKKAKKSGIPEHLRLKKEAEEAARLAEEEAKRKAEAEAAGQTEETTETDKPAEETTEQPKTTTEAPKPFKPAEAPLASEDESGEIASHDKAFSWLRHHPRSPEAALWVVRCLIEQGNYGSANTALSVIRSDVNFPEALRGEMYAVQTHLYLKQGDYENAMLPLQRSIEMTKNRPLRARYHFIMAQLLSRSGNVAAAIDNYERVLKLNPDYEMEFFAQINMANIYRDNKLKSGGEISKLLKDLLKDEKNTEYFGLIYYALADIELDGGNEKKGLEYLNLSIQNAGADAQQKAISYLRIADLEYDREAFQPAFYYYDSCMMSLEQTFDRYTEIKDRRDGLKDLVDLLKIIETEEELQRLNALSEKDLDAEIEEMLAKIQEEEEEEEVSFNELNQGREVQLGGTASGSSGDWYFYNSTLRGRGYSEFKKKWGSRPLEDNWRRKDKRTFEEEVEEPLAEGVEGENLQESVDLSSDKLTREQIIASLPSTEEKLAASNEKIIAALYQVGNIYKEYFKNDKEAEKVFVDLMTRFPENKYRLQVAYTLYLMADNEKDKNFYKDIVLSEFPTSVFARIITDPEYFEKVEEKDNEVNVYYAATYELYEEERYGEVLTRIKEAEDRFSVNPIKSQFDMLGALSLGQQKEMESFKVALQDVVNNHPATESAVRAQEILTFLQRQKPQGPGTGEGELNTPGGNTDAVPEGSPFDFEPSQQHFVILVVYKTGRDVTDVKNKVSDYNKEYHSLDKLRVSSLLFDQDKTIILIKTFPESQKAMEYYDELAPGDSDIFETLTDGEYKLAAISRSNYTDLYRKRLLEEYFTFFEATYLKE